MPTDITAKQFIALLGTALALADGLANLIAEDTCQMAKNANSRQ